MNNQEGTTASRGLIPIFFRAGTSPSGKTRCYDLTMPIKQFSAAKAMPFSLTSDQKEDQEKMDQQVLQTLLGQVSIGLFDSFFQALYDQLPNKDDIKAREFSMQDIITTFNSTQMFNVVGDTNCEDPDLIPPGVDEELEKELGEISPIIVPGS